MDMHHPTPDDVAAAHELVDWAVARLADRRGTLPPADPHADLPPIRAEGIGTAAALDALLHSVIPTTVAPDHPRFLAFIPGTPTVAAALADMALSAAMVFGGSRLEGAAAVDAEEAVVRWLADAAGFPAGAGGTFVSGGSIASLSALVAARGGQVRLAAPPGPGRPATRRTRRWPPPRACWAATCVVAEPADDHGRLDGRVLRAALEGHDPDDVVAVVATAGATNNGAVDDLSAVAGVCEEAGIWLHVDGAYGGAALLSPRTRGLFAGIERADSFIVNPHKWLYLPFDCAAVVYRDERRARQALTQRADYLDVINDDEDGNPSDLGLHLTRRARGLPLWASVLAYGTDAYVRAIDHCLDLAEYAAGRIAGESGPRTRPRAVALGGRLPPPRLETGRLRLLERRGPALRSRHGHPDQTRGRDRAAPLLHQPADDEGRYRSGPRRSGARPVTEEPLAVVTMVMGTFAADVIRAALEDAGIPAATRGEQHSSWLFAGSGGGLGLVQVLVERDRLAEAKTVLEALETAADEPAPPEG